MDTTETIVSLVRQHVELKAQLALAAEREKELKSRITEILKSEGEPDVRGSLSLEIDDKISGVSKVVWQKRVSKSLDMEAAEDLLEAKDLLDRCVTMMPVLDEEEIMKAYYEDLLTETDVDAMFPEKISWALITTKL